MSSNNMHPLKYKELLNQIEGQENHLLLGNGFNRGLGIDTSYKAIFEKMIDNRNSVYKDAINITEMVDYDLELFISKLEEDIADENTFLRKYINNKVKIDFMQAAHEIVKDEIKNVYAEKNEGVYILLKKFTNYFTLNYDSLLYLLLLNFKAPEINAGNTIAMQPTLQFQKHVLDIKYSDLYTEIKQIRNGSLTITPDEIINPTNTPIDKVIKTTFVALINQYSKSNNKGWKTKYINEIVDFIFEEEKENPVLDKVDDGSRQLTMFDTPELVFDINSLTQNLFFLHGAFHIYKDGEKIKKITQKSDKALYTRLEEVLSNEEQDIVCVFQSENKLDVIKENAYLNKCYNTLKQLSGNMVILGSSISDNDSHIFEQINNSDINKVFISVMELNDKTHKAAQKYFPEKEIYYFDARTINYELPEY